MSSASRPPSPPRSPLRDSGDSPQSERKTPRNGNVVRRHNAPMRTPLGMALSALGTAGLAMFMTSGPLWMTIIGMVSGVASLVCTGMALLGLRQSQRRMLIVLSTLVAVILAGFAVLTGSVRLLFWDTVSGYEQCMSSSVTISGEAACQEQMEENLRGVLLPGVR
ncbi:MAG: hypothetical protein Q4C81_08600 [Kocuria sp.]|nr:hypothetical protein [Kocuria sp.]